MRKYSAVEGDPNISCNVQVLGFKKGLVITVPLCRYGALKGPLQ